MYYVYVKMAEEGESGSIEVYKSPTERLKNTIIRLLEENISHNSKTRNKPDEIYAFCRKTKDLSILLERFTPKEKYKELLEWYKQLNQEISDINQKQDYSLTKEKKDLMILQLEYDYALEVHNHNAKIILNSPIIETDVEGELDVNDEDLLQIIQLKEARSDDKRIEFKQ